MTELPPIIATVVGVTFNGMRPVTQGDPVVLHVGATHQMPIAGVVVNGSPNITINGKPVVFGPAIASCGDMFPPVLANISEM